MLFSFHLLIYIGEKVFQSGGDFGSMKGEGGRGGTPPTANNANRCHIHCPESRSEPKALHYSGDYTTEHPTHTPHLSLAT